MDGVAQAERHGALDGLRVLDVASTLGAYVSRILGDLGADVIKIEPPGGDPSRRQTPWLTTSATRLSLPFVHANLNKRSICLDLDQPQDQEQFRRLAAQADVVVSTEPAAVWARRGLDLEQLSQHFPHLVWTSLTPFGLHGPYSTFTGTNIVAEAMGGLMAIQGDDTRPPCVSPYEQGTHLASLHAAFGTLSALWERRRSGCGQVVEVSLQEVLIPIYYGVVRYDYSADILRRTGARNPQPANGYYRCQDGHVFVCVLQRNHWERLVALSEDPYLLNPAVLEREYRLAHAEEIDAHLQQFAARFERWAFTEMLQQRGLPVAPVCTIADLATNVHLKARDFFVDLTQPPLGRLRGPGPLWRSSAAPLHVRRPAPQPGEHQAEILHVDALSSTPPRPDTPASRGLPLAGLRILDLSRVWAGPYGTRYLADLGAEVIKVESGKFPDTRRPHDAAFAEINHNKTYITLNFQLPEGRDLLMRLVAMSDVVVENFTPRVMTQYQLDYQHLRAVRPDLIMVSMPGFGQTGPHRAFVSYGGPLMAYTGMALLWGHPESPIDAHSKIAYPDYLAAGACALAITAALHHRAKTGEGQCIEIAQVEATATALAVPFFDYFATGTIAAPMGNRDPNYVPQGCYPCLGEDAWCVISCATEAQWHALAQVIGGAGLAAEPQFATAEARWAQHDALDALISAWTQQRTPYQVMRLLQAVGVPAGVVQSPEDIWRDVHLRTRHALVTLDHPEIGPVTHPGPTVRLHSTPGCMRRPAGRLGEDNREVFCGLLGLAAQEFERLVANGVIA
jgi:crotonobetainyl-CoA:carnitine CoA-transferase CaiB-like acyl-CoA transferase